MMFFILIFNSIFTLFQSPPSSIILNTSDAVVWSPEQTIEGELKGLTAGEVVVHHNGQNFLVGVKEGNFSFDLVLKEQQNRIWVEVPGNIVTISDTLDYILGYDPVPILKPSATIINDEAKMSAEVIENPYNLPLKYYWKEGKGNPAKTVINNPSSDSIFVKIPEAIGDYYYEVAVIAKEDSTWYSTKITRNIDSLYYFNVDKEYPTWMDDAIIYQITPASFVKDGTFEDITTKLSEIKELGINTIWLQPIFGTHNGGQGYDVTDYMGLNPKLGNEEQLRTLISKAKELKMRVLFDVVLNHSSINHPYAKDRIQNGKKSHYYNFYQHEDDGKPYSSHYNQDDNGFINYFWDDLVNLNYNNEEVCRWMLESVKFWVREFDIDGYRLDAIWGVNSRNPAFAKRMRTELKSIKPEVLLLAEDKGSNPEVYEMGFDAAYDWTTDTTWVSQWSWEHQYVPKESHTIFNLEEVEERDEMLEAALFKNGGNNHRKLFYIENNDLPSFSFEHGLKRTKMAAALLFAMPGIPMLYNGQEIGFPEHPYSGKPIFSKNSSILSLDKTGLFEFYKKIISLHKKYPALSGGNMTKIPVKEGEAVVIFSRRKMDQNFVVVVNLNPEPVNAVVDLTSVYKETDMKSDKHFVKDVLSSESFALPGDPSEVKIPLSGYAIKWLLFNN